MLSITKKFVPFIILLVTLVAWCDAVKAGELKKTRMTSNGVKKGSAKHNRHKVQLQPLVFVEQHDDYVLDYMGANYFLNGQNGWKDNNGNLEALAEGFGGYYSPDLPLSTGMWLNYRSDSIRYPLVKVTFDVPTAGWHSVSIKGWNILPLALFEDDGNYLPYDSLLKQWSIKGDSTYTETLLLPAGRHKLVFYPKYHDDEKGDSEMMFIQEIQIRFVEADDSAGN